MRKRTAAEQTEFNRIRQAEAFAERQERIPANCARCPLYGGNGRCTILTSLQDNCRFFEVKFGKGERVG